MRARKENEEREVAQAERRCSGPAMKKTALQLFAFYNSWVENCFCFENQLALATLVNLFSFFAHRTMSEI